MKFEICDFQDLLKHQIHIFSDKKSGIVAKKCKLSDSFICSLSETYDASNRILKSNIIAGYFQNIF